MKNNFNPLKTTLFLITLISFINFSFAQDKKGRSERIDRKETRDITKTRDQKVRDLPEKANTKIEGNRIQKNKDVSSEKRGQSTRNINVGNTKLENANRNTFESRKNYATLERPAARPVYYNRHVSYNAHNPSWRYVNLPRRNSYFNYLPSSYFSINYGGFGYRYYNGVFYRPYNNLFMVAYPPIGIYINTLPFGYRRIMVRNNPYYYYNGIYYNQTGSNYYVVSPPVGAVVESLPEGYETVVIDGETYYTVDGAQYKPTIQENGEIWYEVIKAN